MAFILSDESLNKLVCSSCEKYLSVKPVKIYSNGLTKCGRCVSNEDDGVISFFGLVAENALFPCINRYEGCQRYLQYSEVSDHEINCEARRYLCPLCPSHIYQPAPAYQFPNHYKRHHAKEILIQPEFFIDINEECEKNLFYCKNNCIYIINVRRYLNEMNLLLNASVLGSKERCKSIKQKICLYTIDKELLVETREKSCSTLDNNSNAFKIPLSTLITNLSPFIICSFRFFMSDDDFILLPNSFQTNSTEDITIDKGIHNVFPKIYLSPEFMQAYPEIRLSPCQTKIVEMVGDTRIEFPRICYICENIFQISGEASSLFICSNDHFVCQSCSDNGKCCGNDWIFAERETEIYNLLFFYCKWDCQRFYCGPDLSYHESRCRANDEIFLTDDDVARKYFGREYSRESSCLVTRSNVFLYDQFTNGHVSQIFTITRDYFSFVLFCRKDDNYLRFWFSHKYDVDKFYFLIRIKERHVPLYHRVNSFSLDVNNGNIISFAVLLRKVAIKH